MKLNKSIAVLYHKNCPDGFGAAWAAWKKFKNKADYIALDPHVLPEEKLKGKEIYVVDNSFEKSVLEKLMRTNKSVVVMDHHKSAQKDVESFPQNIFDNSHSGAVLAWNYFHPNIKVPMLLQYVEDGDLWNFKLPQTKFVRLYITSHPYDFSVWNELAKKIENKKTRNLGIEQGKAISRYVDQVVGEVIGEAEYVQFLKFRVFAVNFPSKKTISVIGHILAEKTNSLGIVWYESNGILHVSLRSSNKVDVSKIAGQFGGGGHKNAAAFSIPFTGKFPWKRIKV
ncbi:MAG: DHHA1 domain-containing protein [Candidatus Paceibacterota bacterium]|jgi:oligoribonuclease NrnB/cAMP/cGMP phosphodiesterase (DHH superfamily)